MNYKTLKRFATLLLVLLFFMPVLATIMLSVQSTKEAQQYDGLQMILMGIYNAPFVLVSIIALLTGHSFQNKLKEKAANTSLVISIGSSVIGVIIMFMWGLGQL